MGGFSSAFCTVYAPPVQGCALHTVHNALHVWVNAPSGGGKRPPPTLHATQGWSVCEELWRGIYVVECCNVGKWLLIIWAYCGDGKTSALHAFRYYVLLWVL